MGMLNQNIDILLPYDHFDIDNLDMVCRGLSKQRHSDYILKILIDPLQTSDAIDILEKYPDIKHELYEYNIFETVVLDYTAMAKVGKKFSNLKFNKQSLTYQQSTKVVSFGVMVSELLKYANSDYINIIDPYTEILPEHFNSLNNLNNDIDMLISNCTIKTFLNRDLYAPYLHLNNDNMDIWNSNNNPKYPNDTTNKFNNLSNFIFKNNFTKKTLNDIDNLSRFGLYWQIINNAKDCSYQYMDQITTIINIERYLDHYTYCPIQPMPEHLHQNNYDHLNDDYYQAMPKFDYNLDTRKYNNVLVTIGMPFYNEEQCAHVVLDNILKQTYTNLEIICVNDKSTDSTLDILNEYANKDPRIKIINHENNLGLSGSRNTIIDNANGQYIHFVDGDDFLRHDAVQQCLDIFNKQPEIDFVLFKLLPCYYKEISTEINNLIVNTTFVNNDQETVHTYDTYPDVLPHASASLKCFKLSYLRQHKLYFKLGAKLEDQLFNWQLQSLKPKFYTLNQTLYYYIIKENSIVNMSFNQKNFTVFQLLDGQEHLFENSPTMQIKMWRLHLQIILATMSVQTRFANRAELTPDEITMQMQYMDQSRQIILQKHIHKYQQLMVALMENPDLSYGIFIILTTFTIALSDDDYQIFSQYFIKKISVSHNIYDLVDQIKPNLFLPTNASTPKDKQKLMNRVYNDVLKLNKNHHARIMHDSKLQTMKYNYKQPYIKKKFLKTALKSGTHQIKIKIYQQLIKYHCAQLLK